MSDEINGNDDAPKPAIVDESGDAIETKPDTDPAPEPGQTINITAFFKDDKSTMSGLHIDDRLRPLQIMEVAAALEVHAKVLLEAMAMQAIAGSARSRLVMARNLPRA